MFSKILMTIGALILCTPSVFALEKILPLVPNAALVGRGVLTYGFWDIYEASLYAPQGLWSPFKPFVLSIEYYQEIQGKDIADQSVKEIRLQGFSDEQKLNIWNEQMKALFPDVKKGTILTALYAPAQQTTFYQGDKMIGVIKDGDFGRYFFSIWLSEKTSEPELRRALLGLS